MRTLYGEMIRRARDEKGLSLPELADRCLIKEEYLEKAESGEAILSDADIVLVCNVLEISSVALREGRLVRKADLPDLDELIDKLQAKVNELQESIQEMKTAAASLTILTNAKELELRALQNASEKEAIKEISEKESDIVPDKSAEEVPEKKEVSAAKSADSPDKEATAQAKAEAVTNNAQIQAPRL